MDSALQSALLQICIGVSEASTGTELDKALESASTTWRLDEGAWGSAFKAYGALLDQIRRINHRFEPPDDERTQKIEAGFQYVEQCRRQQQL